jgi:hypothetical protein
MFLVLFLKRTILVQRFESQQGKSFLFSEEGGCEIHQTDVPTAFLKRDLMEDTYLKRPEGFVVKGPGRV